MGKRFVRLKELGCNVNKNYIPNDRYLELNPKLQSNEIYPTKTNDQGNQFSIWGQKNNEKSIYIIGGSTIESVYLRPSKKPHNYLEKILLERGCCYNVFNQGVSGTQTQNIINVIINKLGNKQDSVLVLTLPTNDATVLKLESNYFSDHWRYASLVPAFNKDVPLIKNINYEPYLRNLKIIIKICEILKLKLFITSVIYTGENYKFKNLNEIAKDICKKNCVPFIDFENKFLGQNDFFYNDVHFLPKGSQRYAEIVFENIKDVLDVDGTKKISIHNICNNMIIGNKIHWSEHLNVSTLSTIKILVDGEFSLDCSSKQALLSIDYGIENISTTLQKSNNKDIGYFKYLTAPAGKRIELIVDLQVPSECTKIRVGLRAWNDKHIKIHDAFVSLITNQHDFNVSKV